MSSPMRRTEYFVLAAVVFSLGAVDAASSGDLLPQIYAPPSPVVPPSYVWTTCYGGLNAGGVWRPSMSAFGFPGGGAGGGELDTTGLCVVGGGGARESADRCGQPRRCR